MPVSMNGGHHANHTPHYWRMLVRLTSSPHYSTIATKQTLGVNADVDQRGEDV
jgi:hypothetical protein